MANPKVIRIITRLNVGGPAYQATILNNLLPKMGYDSMLIYGKIDKNEASYESLLKQYPGKTYFAKNLQRKINPINDALALVEIIKIVRKYKPDIIHTHTAKAGTLGRIAAKICKTKIILHTYHGHVLRNYFSKPTEKLFITIEQQLAKKSTRLITLSNSLAADLANILRTNQNEIITVELGLPLEKFKKLPEKGKLRAQLNIPQQAILLGSLGRLVPIKNYSRMINIFSQLTEILPEKNLHLIIGGSGPLESELRTRTEKLGVKNRIHFPGIIQNLPQFYADIDIAILTSDNEGTPAMLIEAQSAGKITIAPDIGGIRDILCPETGKLIARNQTGPYIKTLSEIIEHWPPKPVTDQTREKIITRFSPQKLAKNITTLYNKLLTEQKNKDKTP